MADETDTGARGESTEVERLLADFEHPSHAEWRDAAEKSLKGAPFEKKLMTRTPEGITLKPVYDADDLEGIEHLGGLPGLSPYVRSSRAAGASVRSWEVAQEINLPTPEEVRVALAVDLPRGQDAIRFSLDAAGRAGVDPDEADEGTVGEGGVSIIGSADLGRLFGELDPTERPLYVDPGAGGLPMAALVAALVGGGEGDLSRLEGCLGGDPLGALAREGGLPRSLAALYDEMAVLTGWAEAHAPLVKTVLVSGSPYHDAGASAVEELAFALATGVEYLRQLGDRGIDAVRAAPRFHFSFSAGANFFMEVAKLRAARLVWDRAVGAFGGDAAARRMTLHVRTSAWTKTTTDPWVNMLRATTETFSAAVGGAESITVSPFDEPARQPDDFSRRHARNIQVVLEEESHANHVVDPAGGSWYVEALTDQVASRAWELFQEVEAAGGMAAALASGSPQEKVAETAAARGAALDTRKAVFIGTNIYANAAERPLEPRAPRLDLIAGERRDAAKKAKQEARSALVEEVARKGDGARSGLFEAASAAAAGGATLGQLSAALGSERGAPEQVAPLGIHRGAERHERLRRAVAEFAAARGKRPRVFLANLGPISQHKARADFSTGFFEVGGFEVLGNDGFPTPEEAAAAARDSEAEVVVICSTDPTYPELVPQFLAALEKRHGWPRVVLAGYPKDQIDAHRESGVDEFIHVKANNYDILSRFLEQIGVES